MQPQRDQKKTQKTQRNSAPQWSQSKPSASSAPSVPQWSQEKYPHSKLTERVIGIAIQIHKKLGPGYVEKIYQRALYLELKRNGIKFQREKKVDIYYNNANLGYEKVDFDIESEIIVELKAVSEIQDIHKAQLISYLKAANRKVGLILNFAKEKLEIKRVVK